MTWNTPVTDFVFNNLNDRFRRAMSAEEFYREALLQSATTTGDSMGPARVHGILAEYLWHEHGKPTWFIPSKLSELLMSCRVDDDLTGIRFPYDVMFLCFESGFRIHKDIPLRSILLVTTRSDLAFKTLEKFLGWHVEKKERETISDSIRVAVDFGISLDAKTQEFKISEDPKAMNQKFFWTRAWNEDVEFKKLSERPKNIDISSSGIAFLMGDVIKLAVASMMYYAARPERVQPFALPRSQRFVCGFNSRERESFKTLFLPAAAKNINQGNHEGHSYTVSPHHRGFVYRVLRDKKYRRNPDGTFRVIEIPPCAIHPELMECAKTGASK